MEPETFDLDAASKALALFLVIPVVIFTLWGDYFGRHLDKILIENPKQDRNLEAEKVRIGSLIVVLFQFTLFLNSSEIRHAFPITSQVSFTIAVLLQLLSQSSLERKINPKPKQDPGLWSLAGRAFFSWLTGSVVYLIILVALAKIGFFIATKFHASNEVSAFLLLISTCLGMIISLSLNYILEPLQLKKILPTEPLKNSEIKKRITQCFIQYGISLPQLSTITLKTVSTAPILIAGVKNGRGPFRQHLFISDIALQKLTPSEIEALTLNQISHIKLQHLKKRFLLVSLSIGGTAVLTIFSIILGKTILSAPLAFEILGPIVALTSLLGSLVLIVRQSKHHEHHSDIYTIKNLGISVATWIHLLRKLHSNSEASPQLPSVSKVNKVPTHSNLELERRIELIKHHFTREETLTHYSERKAS